MNDEQKIITLLDRLEPLYHNEADPPNLKHPEPLDGLILTVLSQNTNDKNRDAAFNNLKTLYPTWDLVVAAGAEKLEQAIKQAGIAHTKSKRIIEILNRLKAQFGDYSLKKLTAKKNPDDVRDYLLDFPGVGVKTASCVVLFDFELPAFPVDTHITRVSIRLGIAPEKTSPEEITEIYEAVVPPERCLGGHVNIISHGRNVCRARKPSCSECVLKDICLYHLEGRL